MEPMAEAEDASGDGLPEGYAFDMEIVSNNGDALEKMGRVDASEKGVLRKLFDLFF